MVGFVDAVLAALKLVHAPPPEKLHALVSMYGHAMDASSLLWSQCRRVLITHQTTQAITFDAMENALFRKATELHGAISSTMEETKALVEAAADDDPTEIARGSGDDVHTSARVMVDCVVSSSRSPTYGGFVASGGYIDGYFSASWAPVLSCLSSKSGLSPWSNKSSPLRKFELAFHETYTAQKLWKVPSPELRKAAKNYHRESCFRLSRVLVGAS
ncbi:hypothetical protein OsI_03883 [Oryza sativa Indica Group]|uniref:Exocyst subunit Exo70 family protein n=1 Tax=Oryza sativa subsp. indica TaxID=39946 RepID=A2WVG8_ORYSI|nr:hypothetical protein OsI_03883 [Oryza sativa Indica Group]